MAKPEHMLSVVHEVAASGTRVYQHRQLSIVQFLKCNETPDKNRIVCTRCVEFPHVYWVRVYGRDQSCR